jgi:hypothetical protein
VSPIQAKPAPGPILNVDDLPAEIAALRKLPLHIPSDIALGPDASKTMLDNPSDNPVEPFQAACDGTQEERHSNACSLFAKASTGSPVQVGAGRARALKISGARESEACFRGLAKSIQTLKDIGTRQPSSART